MDTILKINKITQQAIDGELNELDVYIKLKVMKDLITKCQAAIKEAAWSEVLRHSKSFEFNGYKVTQSQKTTWSYKHLENWNDKKKELESIQTAAKQAVIMNNKLLIDQDTGEVQECATKTVTDVIKIELIKK